MTDETDLKAVLVTAFNKNNFKNYHQIVCKMLQSPCKRIMLETIGGISYFLCFNQELEVFQVKAANNQIIIPSICPISNCPWPSEDGCKMHIEAFPRSTRPNFGLLFSDEKISADYINHVLRRVHKVLESQINSSAAHQIQHSTPQGVFRSAVLTILNEKEDKSLSAGPLRIYVHSDYKLNLMIYDSHSKIEFLDCIAFPNCYKHGQHSNGKYFTCAVHIPKDIGKTKLDFGTRDAAFRLFIQEHIKESRLNFNDPHIWTNVLKILDNLTEDGATVNLFGKSVTIRRCKKGRLLFQQDNERIFTCIYRGCMRKARRQDFEISEFDPAQDTCTLHRPLIH